MSKVEELRNSLPWSLMEAAIYGAESAGGLRAVSDNADVGWFYDILMHARSISMVHLQACSKSNCVYAAMFHVAAGLTLLQVTWLACAA